MISAPRNIELGLACSVTCEREQTGERIVAAGAHDQPHHGNPVLSKDNIGQRIANGASDDVVHFVGVEGSRPRHHSLLIRGIGH